VSELKLQYKSDFSCAQHYWDAFWNRQIIDRPCTVIWAQKNNYDYPPAVIQSTQADFENTFKKHDLYLESHAFLGECMPGFRPGFGPDQMAGFFGAPIILGDEKTSTSWSEKIVDDWTKFLPLTIKANNNCFARMQEYHVAAAKHYCGRCLILNIDLHSNIDTLEGLRGAEKLIFDMIDEPELTMRALADVRKHYSFIYDMFYRLAGGPQWGTSDRCLGLYSREKYNIVSGDLISLLSPDMFRKFVLPAFEEEAGILDNSCFHLDGPGAIKHLEDILTIDAIDVVQWQPGSYNKPAFEWPEVIDKIQGTGKSTVIAGTCEQIKAVHGRFKPNLLVYNIMAQTEDEGFELLDWLKKHT